MSGIRRIVIGCGYSTFPTDNVNSVRTYDADLNAEWKYNHGANVHAVAADTDGNVYMAGARASSLTTRKLDTDGAAVWSVDHGATAYAIAVGSDGVVATGGARTSSITTRTYAYDGTAGWTADHGATVFCIAIDSSGNVYTGGNRYTTSSPQGHVRKYNSSGTLQWTLDLGSSVSYVYGIAVDSSGNIYVTGYRDSSITTRKYNSSRTLQWSQDEGGNGTAIAIDANGVYIAFIRNSSKSLRKRALSDGAEVWTADTGNSLHGVAVDADGDVYAVSTADYKLYQRLGSDGTAVGNVAQSFQAVYAVAVVDVEVPDQSALPPGLAIPLGLAVPFPTALLTSAALPLTFGLAAPSTLIPEPPIGDGQTVYRGYLGLTPPLQVPLASLHCRRRQNESTWLVVVIPGVSDALETILMDAAGLTLSIDAGLRESTGAETLGRFLRAVVTDVEITAGAFSRDARLTARVQADLEPIQTRAMTGVRRIQDDEGRRSVWCDVNPVLRPGDTIDAGAITFTAHSIQYTIGPYSAMMDVQEAPDG